MNGSRNQRSADISVRNSKPSRELENPRFFAGDGRGAEGENGETRSMRDFIPDGWSKAEAMQNHES